MMPKEHAVIAGQKRKYQTPMLARFGALRELTQSGSGRDQEDRQDKNAGCKNQPRKYPCASDRNLKENIVRIGIHPLSIGLYLFDYKPGYRETWGQGRQFGVMAQEVETVMPQAVSVHPDGYKLVDYAMLGISPNTQS